MTSCHIPSCHIPRNPIKCDMGHLMGYDRIGSFSKLSHFKIIRPFQNSDPLSSSKFLEHLGKQKHPGIPARFRLMSEKVSASTMNGG